MVKVFSKHKGSVVIINLDAVREIAPLLEGGCDIFFTDGALVPLRVTDNFSQFLQLAMEPATPESCASHAALIEKKFPTKKGKAKADGSVEIPKFGDQAE